MALFSFFNWLESLENCYFHFIPFVFSLINSFCQYLPLSWNLFAKFNYFFDHVLHIFVLPLNFSFYLFRLFFPKIWALTNLIYLTWLYLLFPSLLSDLLLLLSYPSTELTFAYNSISFLADSSIVFLDVSTFYLSDCFLSLLYYSVRSLLFIPYWDALFSILAA